MNYSQCLQKLRDVGHELRHEKFDLDSILKITRALGDPQSKYPTAIIAGTNGKGSTSAMLAGILGAAGYRTGLYTSPHLVRVNERIRVNEQDISDGDFARAFTEVSKTVDDLIATHELPQGPSFFEYLTATAFLHFAHAGIEFAVLEVGMGGRLDATNITQPRVVVITNVELDHQHYLGSTHAAIAWEKAGVIKPDRPVISACENADAEEVIGRRAAELRAPLLELSRISEVSNIQNLQGRQSFDLVLQDAHLPGLISPLVGCFQIKNTVAAVAATLTLGQEGFEITRDAIRKGLKSTRWPGRMEKIGDHPLVILDGGHNPAAAREIAATVSALWPGRTLRLVYASMRDKAIGEISEVLFPMASQVYLTRPDQDRAATPEDILAATKISPRNTVIEPSPARALERACRESSPEDVVLVAGSLFLVGSIKQALLEKRLVLESMAGHLVGLPKS